MNKCHFISSLQSDSETNILKKYGTTSQNHYHIHDIAILKHNLIYTKPGTIIEIDLGIERIFKIISKTLQNILYDYITKTIYKCFKSQYLFRISIAEEFPKFV
jgi:hypothetical protein